MPDNTAGRIEIVYYTDPLCCWSWALEPQLQQLKDTYKSLIQWRYCMGGLLQDWDNYHDQLNDITRPAQMGPLWMEVQRLSGMPVNDRIWIENPPASSYPACIAVKCAGQQSEEMGQVYLHHLREAVMLNRKNIAYYSELSAVAEFVEKEYPEAFNAQLFKSELMNDASIELFRKDLQETQNNNIARLPTLTLKNASGKGIMIVGFKPFIVLNDAVQNLID